MKEVPIAIGVVMIILLAMAGCDTSGITGNFFNVPKVETHLVDTPKAPSAPAEAPSSAPAEFEAPPTDIPVFKDVTIDGWAGRKMIMTGGIYGSVTGSPLKFAEISVFCDAKSAGLGTSDSQGKFDITASEYCWSNDFAYVQVVYGGKTYESDKIDINYTPQWRWQSAPPMGKVFGTSSETEDATAVPEFSSVAAAVALVAAMGMMLFMRKR